MRSMYDGLEKVADLRLKGTNLGWGARTPSYPIPLFIPRSSAMVSGEVQGVEDWTRLKCGRMEMAGHD